MDDSFKKIISTLTIAASVIGIASGLWVVVNWVTNTNARISELTKTVNAAQLKSIPKQTDDALAKIADQTNDVISLIEAEKLELRKLDVAIQAERQENSAKFTSLSNDFEKKLEGMLRKYEVLMRQEFDDVRLSVGRSITKRVKEFDSQLNDIPTALASLDLARSDLDEARDAYEARLDSLNTKINDVNSVLRSYQANVESRLSDVSVLPAGALIHVTGRRPCPQGYVEYSKSIFLAFKEDLDKLKANDFEKDSAFNFGVVPQAGANTLGFVDQNNLDFLSYDGKSVRVCRKG